MKIREIHIDGFGIFANKHIDSLRSGINVVYGANESGKSTILAFIRQMLFGFARSSANTNAYPSLAGGSYGGRLVCELDDGRGITIERTDGPRGGMATITTDSGQLLDQEELSRLLDHMTGTFYRNVYAVGLDELQTIRSLQEEEVRSLMFGAGLGLGSTSLPHIENELRSQGETIYRARGTSQEMPALYKKIRELQEDILDNEKALAVYDDVARERAAFREEVSGIDEHIRTLEATRQSLENRGKLFPTYVELLEAETELSETEGVPDFPKDALGRLHQLKLDLASLQQQFAESEGDLKALQAKRDGLHCNEGLLGQESSVIALQKLSERYTAASEDIALVEAERASLAESIEKRAAKIGKGWTTERLRDFDLGHAQEDRMRACKAKLEEAKNKANGCKSKLELHREEAVVESIKAFALPDLYRYAVYVVAGLGLTGVLAGFLFSNLVLAGFSAVLLIIGILVCLEMRKANPMQASDGLEARLKEELQKAATEYTRMAKGWREVLTSIGFDESLSPEGALEAVKACQLVQSDLPSLGRLDDRIKRMRGIIDSAREQHDRLLPYVDKSEVGSDVAANVEVFATQLTKAKEAERDREAIEGQINAEVAKAAKASESLQAKEQEIKDYISCLKAEDENDLMVKYEKHSRRNELKDRISECRRTIQSSVGSDKHYDNFTEAMSGTTPEEIQLQLEAANAQLKELRLDRDEKIERSGELQAQIERLRSGGHLLPMQIEVETVKQQLRNLSRGWARSQIALIMLKKAISRYENTRQPEVIKAAEGIFSAITNHTYHAIIKPIDSDEPQIRDKAGNARRLIEISRGTREQLYLAMRLGLIKEYENESESMPVVMDDILVNFDDDRGLLLVKELQAFAKNRQLIVLTCHSNALGMFRDIGANEIMLN